MKRLFCMPAFALLAAFSWIAVSGCGGSGQKNSKSTASESAARKSDMAAPAAVAEHHEEAVPAEHGMAEGHHEESAENGAMPATLSGIWAEIEHERGELGEVIEAGKLNEVHVIAFRIRDLVGAMSPHSGTQLAGKEAEMTDAVTRVGQIAALLDETGDAGDAAATKTQKTRYDQVLDYIKSLYPAGALAGS